MPSRRSHLPREYLAISGPSGCGKSTLLSILGLLDSPSDGQYRLNGRRVAGLKMSARARTRNREIGFIFQSFNLIGDLTVYESVELPLTYRGMRPAERRQRVNEALGKGSTPHRPAPRPAPVCLTPTAAGPGRPFPRSGSPRCLRRARKHGGGPAPGEALAREVRGEGGTLEPRPPRGAPVSSIWSTKALRLADLQMTTSDGRDARRTAATRMDVSNVTRRQPCSTASARR